MDYNQHPDRERYERKWLGDLFREQIQQGIFVASSGGRYLGRMNRGWPDPDANGTLQAMREALAAYRRLPAKDRVLSKTLAESDRLRWEQDAFKKPAGTLDLRVSSRGYAFEGMTTFDQRHPKFYHLDRLWFKPSEWRAWLPNRLAVGEKIAVTGPAFSRIVLLSHMQAGGSAWQPDHIRSGSMESKVVKVEGSQVSLRIEADYRMLGDTQWCKDAYDGRLLAFANYDKAQDRFSKFEIGMLGTHRVGMMRPNLHVGSPESRVAAHATLNPAKDADDRMIPQAWKYGYTLRWAQAP